MAGTESVGLIETEDPQAGQQEQDPIAALRARKQQQAPAADPIAALRAQRQPATDDPIAAMRSKSVSSIYDPTAVSPPHDEELSPADEREMRNLSPEAKRAAEAPLEQTPVVFATPPAKPSRTDRLRQAQKPKADYLETSGLAKPLPTPSTLPMTPTARAAAGTPTSPAPSTNADEALRQVIGGAPVIADKVPPSDSNAFGEYRDADFEHPARDSVYVHPTAPGKPPREYVIAHELGHRLFEQANPDRSPLASRPEPAVNDPALVDAIKRITSRPYFTKESNGTFDTEEFARGLAAAVESIKASPTHPGYDLAKTFPKLAGKPEDMRAIRSWLLSRPEFAALRNTFQQQAPDATRVGAPAADHGSVEDVLAGRVSRDVAPMNAADAEPHPTSLPGRLAATTGKMMFEHPLASLAVAAAPGVVIPAGMMAASMKLGQFTAQQQRKRAGDWQGPDVVAPREAAFAAGQLLVPGIASKALPYLDDVFGAGMARATVKAVEEGKSPAQALLVGYAARTATHAATAAGIGAVYSPDDPEVGALLGAAIGGAHAGRQMPSVTMDPDVIGPATRNAPRLPAGEIEPPTPATARVRSLVDQPAQTEPDFSVESPAGGSAGAVPPAEKDYLPNWDVKTMGTKPTRAEYEAWKDAAVETLMKHRPVTPPEAPAAEATKMNTPEEIAARDKPAGVAPPEPGPRRFPATATTITDFAKEKGISVDDAAAKLRAAQYDVPDSALEEAKKSEKPKYDYSSTQFNLPAEHGDALKALAAKIPDAHINTEAGGRETEPHITVKYGLHTDNAEKLKDILADQPPVPVRFGKTSIFPADEKAVQRGGADVSDVLKADVDSPELHALNKKIADAMPHTDTFPEYKPHATIAYLKPGEGKKYEGDASLEGRTTTLDKLTFSGKDGKQIEIPLTGKPAAAEPESIRAAAVRTPDGKFIEAPSHWQAVEIAQQQGIDPASLEDVFVTNTGRHVDRVEAESIDAKLSGVEPTGEPLHTNRTAPEARPAERSDDIERAFEDWKSGRAYLDNAGNYRLKGQQYDRYGVLLPTGQRTRSTIAPWNKAAKAAFPDNAEFHRAAAEAAERVRSTDSREEPAGVGAQGPDAEGVEYRNLGLSIPKKFTESFRTAVSQAVTDRNAPIIRQHPELARAIASANAMTPHQASIFATQLAQRAVAGLTEAQQQDFGVKILHDNLLAEAERKAAQADELEGEPFEPEPPKKSSRGLWYSRTTAAGQIRSPGEMETAPLIDELHRRADAAITYQKDPRKFGPTSAVTQRNASKMAEIEAILEGRDGLSPDDVWNEIGRRRQSGVTDDATDFAFGENAAKAGAPLEFNRYEPDAPDHPSDAARAAAENFTKRAAELEPRVKPGIENEPWFQRALKAHLETVQPFLDKAAELAGVNTESFRRPSLGAYMRLIPPARLSEPLIRRAQSIADNEGAGATTPRTGLAKAVLGQKRGVMMASPRGTESPMQGPANVLRDTKSTGGGASVTGTKQSGSAKMATGSAREYSTDYLTNIGYDAADKVSKAAHNQIFTAIAKDAEAGKGGIEELTPDKNAPPNKRVIAFNDSKELVDPPPSDDEMYPKARRFAVPKEVGAAIDRYRERYAYPGVAGRAVRAAMGAVTRSVLMNPVVAGTHTLTLASAVGTGVPAGAGAAKTALSGLPGAKVGSTLARMRGVDFNDPAVTTRLTRLAFNGALRLGETNQGGAINAGHHFLFGPQGMDVRARVVASMDVEDALRKAGIPPDDPRFGGLERKYVVEHAGNYVGRNQGSATKWLQDNGIAPFIAINRAKLGTSLKALVGSDGTIDPSAARRLGIGWRGPLGAAAALAAASYLLSGHKPNENAPGHEGDVATGVYKTPDGQYRYYRGAAKDAVAQFGEGTHEIYLRRGFVDPASEAALRVLQPLVTANQGDKMHDVLHAAVNTALGFVGPGMGAAFGLATGRSLYLDRDGNFASTDQKELPGQKTEQLKTRVIAAARNANAGAAVALPAQGDQPHATLGRPLVNILAEGNPMAREGGERRDVNAVLDARVQSIYAERDPEKRQQLADATIKEFADAGYRGALIRRELQQAVVKASVRGSSQRKFEVRMRGTRMPSDTLKQYPNPYTPPPSP